MDTAILSRLISKRVVVQLFVKVNVFFRIFIPSKPKANDYNTSK